MLSAVLHKLRFYLTTVLRSRTGCCKRAPKLSTRAKWTRPTLPIQRPAPGAVIQTRPVFGTMTTTSPDGTRVMSVCGDLSSIHRTRPRVRDHLFALSASPPSLRPCQPCLPASTLAAQQPWRKSQCYGSWTSLRLRVVAQADLPHSVQRSAAP